nr:hypothetical protein [Tanacetum cinerariifolium]
MIKRMRPNKGKIAELDADEDVTLVDAKEDMNVDLQGRLAESQAKVGTTVVIAAQVPKASAPRRRRGVVIQDPKDTTTASVIVHTEVKSKDKRKGILIEEPKSLKRQAQIEQDEAFARQLEAELNDNINWNDVLEEDLEALWKLVKERFESTEPKNFLDDFLLNTFKIMFEKPNVEANIWKIKMADMD